MQLIKRPFYYNQEQLNSLTYLKILNIQYYTKFIICDQKIESLGVYDIIRFIKIKKKKKGNKRLKIKLKREKFVSDIFIDIHESIEYLEDDFFYKNKVKSAIGFSYNFQNKYFSNYKVLHSDFVEKYFKFNNQKNYLTKYYNNLKFLSLKNQYKLIVPLRPHKGGFISFGFGFKGFIGHNSLRYPTKEQLYYNIKNSWLNLASLVFFSSRLRVVMRRKKFIKKRKAKKMRKIKRMKLKRSIRIAFLKPNLAQPKVKKKLVKKRNCYKTQKKITNILSFKLPKTDFFDKKKNSFSKKK